MRRRELLGASSIVLTTAAAGCATSVFGSSEDRPGSPAGAATGTRQPDGSATTIQVRADGLVEAEPDQATLSVGVEARGDSAETVTDTLAERIESLRTTFEGLGIPADAVETGRYDVRPSREGGGYEGVHYLVVTVDDVERVGEVIDAAAETGADDVGGVRFGLRDETRAELRRQALDEALANADAEAEYVAENRGVELTGTRSVSTSNVDVVPAEARTAELEMAGDEAAPPTELAAGPVTVSASVVVTYGFR